MHWSVRRILHQSSLGRYNLDVTTSRQLLFLLLLVSSALLEAQEVRLVDLINIEQRTALRSAPAQQPDCATGEPCEGGGVGGISITDGGPDPRDPHALGVALDRVMPTDITLDAFEGEFRLINTGLVPIDVPVSPHLSDLQPPEEWQPFSYLSLGLEVFLTSAGQTPALGIGWVQLYGAVEHEGTIIALKPGQWIRVRAKVKLHTWPSRPIEGRLRGDFWFHRNVYRPQNGGGSTDVVNVYPNHTVLPELTVHFSPTRTTPKQ